MNNQSVPIKIPKHEYTKEKQISNDIFDPTQKTPPQNDFIKRLNKRISYFESIKQTRLTE